ncbi:MAG: hypothetical protein ABI831_16615, partial [Betaproteobacteria bacterium]
QLTKKVYRRRFTFRDPREPSAGTFSSAVFQGARWAPFFGVPVAARRRAGKHCAGRGLPGSAHPHVTPRMIYNRDIPGFVCEKRSHFPCSTRLCGRRAFAVRSFHRIQISSKGI